MISGPLDILGNTTVAGQLSVSGTATVRPWTADANMAQFSHVSATTSNAGFLQQKTGEIYAYGNITSIAATSGDVGISSDVGSYAIKNKIAGADKLVITSASVTASVPIKQANSAIIKNGWANLQNGTGTYAVLTHQSLADDYQNGHVRVNNLGEASINSSAGRSLFLGINNASIMELTSTAITASVDVTASAKLKVDGDFYHSITYWGLPNVDGSWRTYVSGTNLVTEKRISGTWTNKQTIVG